MSLGRPDLIPRHASSPQFMVDARAIGTGIVSRNKVCSNVMPSPTTMPAAAANGPFLINYLVLSAREASKAKDYRLTAALVSVRCPYHWTLPASAPR